MAEEADQIPSEAVQDVPPQENEGIINNETSGAVAPLETDEPPTETTPTVDGDQQQPNVVPEEVGVTVENTENNKDVEGDGGDGDAQPQTEEEVEPEQVGEATEAAVEDEAQEVTTEDNADVTDLETTTAEEGEEEREAGGESANNAEEAVENLEKNEIYTEGGGVFEAGDGETSGGGQFEMSTEGEQEEQDGLERRGGVGSSIRSLAEGRIDSLMHEKSVGGSQMDQRRGTSRSQHLESREMGRQRSERLGSKARAVLGSTMSFGNRLTTAADLMDKAKALRYMNSYRLNAEKPFNPEWVNIILQQSLPVIMEDLAVYEPTKCIQRAKWASMHLLNRIKEMEYDRYKLVCIVTIGEKHSQDMYVLTKFLWDPERDAYAYCSEENVHVFVAIQCFGIYYE